MPFLPNLREHRMPRFLAVYTMKPEDFARFRSLPKPEQDAINTIGVKQWADWEERNAASFLDRGGMVGKTTRVTRDGIAGAMNSLCGYNVVEAETIEAAARLFEKITRIFLSFQGTAWTSCPSSLTLPPSRAT